MMAQENAGLGQGLRKCKRQVSCCHGHKGYMQVVAGR